MEQSNDEVDQNDPVIQRKHIGGIVLLLLVVLLWVGASFLMSHIFNYEDYNKPFFSTYLNTSSFSLYLIILFISGKLPNINDESYATVDGIDIANEDSFSKSNEDNDISDDENSQIDIVDSNLDLQKNMTFKETIRLSLEFCCVWFLANYFVNLSLTLTTVTSSTIISSTSSLWTLVIGSLIKVEKFSFTRLFSIFISVAGVLLVTLSKTDPKSRSDLSLESWKIHAGNLMALTSAILYGIYITLLKKKVGNEERMNMLLFFGLVGVFNVILLWPFFVLLHLTGIETFEFPPTLKIWGYLLLNALLGTCLSEYLWLLSMLMTSPLVATVGISLAIPLAMTGDFIQGESYSIQFIIGALLVIIGFLIVNLAGVLVKLDSYIDASIWAFWTKIAAKLLFPYRQYFTNA